ncbi:uncharacterized protein EHS24_001199 [Apiotrichum porosum]|uniref:Nodulin-like domain-containing protein n=1 Tax=Apiotrichum porosum TaxID=105984 RepID=A0A427XJT9_9TREE|nr:uncharacterized protein EHS24_001199 [Apiotrichum porosum]RSH79161.1 hypothetical protein EHS24_001199 [Apiotrichum porosum]
MDEGSPTARTRMFITAVVVGLASGSNYVYSGYAPQLASTLDITSTDSNLIGLGGNLGMYITGPIWGLVVDRRGPQLPLLCASVLNFVGYTAVRAFYNGILPIRSAPDQPAARPLIFLLALFMFMTGSAGSAGLTAAMNAVAKSYPDRSRAAYTGAVLAGFGLSAFLFSMLGHFIFHGEAGGLLLLLSIGTSAPHLIGSFIIKPYPPPESEDQHEVHDGQPLDDEQECALARQVSLSATAEGQVFGRRSSELDVELLDDSPSASDPLIRKPPHNRSDSTVSLPPTQIHFTPLEAMRKTDFHIIYAVLAILCGVGLEWINNVGAVTLALARDGWDYDSHLVAEYQARQVATISVFNCLGRILGGVMSDTLKLRFGIKRIWFLPLVALMFLGSEIAVLNTTEVAHLWLVSASLGLAYGTLFNVMPMLVLEWFGMTYFSSNWGFVSTAPIIGGNVFNLIFGRVYDSNTVGRVGAPEGIVSSGVNLLRSHTRAAAVLGHLTPRSAVAAAAVAATAPVAPGGGGGGDRAHECLLGPACFTTAFQISALGCIVALGLSIVAGVRRERAARRDKLARAARVVPS